MNSTKYAVRFYEVCTEDGQEYLKQTQEVQVHRLINAVVLLSCPAAKVSGAATITAKCFIRERGNYREVQPSDWVPETHDMAKINELSFLP